MSFSVLGMQVRVNFWFVALIAGAAYLGGDMVGLMMAAALHEAGHVAAILWCGGSIERLDAGFFGVRMQPHFPRVSSLGQDLFVLWSGPVVGLLTGLLAFAVGKRHFAWVNLTLSAFNLLPIAGLDGGSVARVLLIDRFGLRGEHAAHTLQTAALLFLLGVGVRLLWNTAVPTPMLLIAACYLWVSVGLRR